MRLIRVQAALTWFTDVLALLGLILVPLLLVLVAIVLVTWGPGASLKDVWPQLRGLSGFGQLSMAYAMAVVVFLWPHLSLRYEAVTIDDDGIRYGFTPPRLFVRLGRAWRVGWDELQSARVELQLGRRAMLRLNTPQGVRSLAILDWVDATQRHRPRFGWLFKSQFDQQMALAQSSPLWQALTARGIAIAVPDRARAVEADLFANRYTLVAVLAIFGLGFYGFVDFMLVEEAYIAGYPKIAVFGLGAGVALVATLILWRQKIKVLQAVGVGAMLGLAFGFAAVPGLLRVNALSDTAGPKAHTYILQAHTRLVSREPQAPTVIFEHDRDYWSLFAVGSEHRLYLRRGGLGFQQVHLTPLYAGMRLRLGPQCRR